MRNTVCVLILLVCCVLESPGAKERVWQRGEVCNYYREFDAATGTVRQVIDLRVGLKMYAIDRTVVTASLRPPRGQRRSPETFEEGEIIQFAVEGKNLIVLGPDGKEQKFRIRKEGVF